MTALPATLITGAASRIGRAIATDLAKVGTPVCIHANSSADKAEALAAELREAGGTAAVVTADLLSKTGMMELVAKASDALEAPIACLINNASIFEKDEAGALTPDLFAEHYAIHATAPAILADRMVSALSPDQAGLIVNITSGRVRVNAIGPGPTLANERQEPQDFQKQVDGLPLKRGPNLDAFAETVTYLWRMPSVTGQMIALDGGQHLAWKTPDIDGINE